MTISSKRAAKLRDRVIFRDHQRKEALIYKHRGLSNVAIGLRLGISESSVRTLLNENKK